VAAELSRPAAPLPAGSGRPAAGWTPPQARPRAARAWLAATVTLTAGAAAAAIALAPPAGAPAPAGLSFLLFAGSSVHVASTGWFYTVPEVRAHMRRNRARYLWWPLALIAGAGAIAMLLPQAALYWLLLPYFGWQFWHYGRQNLGLAALAASAHGVAPLSRPERRSLAAAAAAGIAALLARPGLLQLPARAAIPGLFSLAAAAFAASVLFGTGCLLSRSGAQRPPGFCLAYLTSLAFSLPVFLFTSPYAAVAGLTIAHGLQYLLLMVLVAAGGAGRAGQLAMLANIALAGGAVLSVASDQLTAGPVLRALFGVFAGAVMAHFVVDAGLWRLRADFPRAFLRDRLPYLLAAPGIPAADRSPGDIG
jgi:hypothetical protein